MKTMYKALKIVNPRIEAVEVVRTTKYFVVLKYNGVERKESFESEWCAYFETHKEAKEYLIKFILSEIAVYNLKIQNLEEKLEEVREL